MKINDLGPVLFMLALSAILLLGTAHLGFWDGFAPGPAFFPALIAAAGVLLAVARMIEARQAEEPHDPVWPAHAILGRVAIVFAALVAFVALAPWLGMLPAAALFVAFLLLVVLRQPPIQSLAAAGITIGLIYTVFVWWLDLRIPVGFAGI
jgi:putative tricarboxylic transport membrane protein